MWPLASKRARDKHPEASLKGRRAGGATTVTAGQRTPSGALMAKALTDGADEAKSGGMGTGRASRTPRGSPWAIWTELWAPQGGYTAAAAKPVWIPLALQCSRVYYTALYPICHYVNVHNGRLDRSYPPIQGAASRIRYLPHTPTPCR